MLLERFCSIKSCKPAESGRILTQKYPSLVREPITLVLNSSPTATSLRCSSIREAVEWVRLVMSGTKPHSVPLLDRGERGERRERGGCVSLPWFSGGMLEVEEVVVVEVVVVVVVVEEEDNSSL